MPIYIIPIVTVILRLVLAMSVRVYISTRPAAEMLVLVCYCSPGTDRETQHACALMNNN